jgi:hypothetical protein
MLAHTHTSIVDNCQLQPFGRTFGALDAQAGAYRLEVWLHPRTDHVLRLRSPLPHLRRDWVPIGEPRRCRPDPDELARLLDLLRSTESRAVLRHRDACLAADSRCGRSIRVATFHAGCIACTLLFSVFTAAQPNGIGATAGSPVGHLNGLTPRSADYTARCSLAWSRHAGGRLAWHGRQQTMSGAEFGESFDVIRLQAKRQSSDQVFTELHAFLHVKAAAGGRRSSINTSLVTSRASHYPSSLQ